MANEKNKGFLTTAEYEAIKAEKSAQLNRVVSQFNDCDDKTEADKLEAEIKELQKAYNDASRCMVMLGCIEAEEDTIVAACRTRVYPVIKVSAKRLDSGAKVYEVSPDLKLIDLTSFNRTVIAAWFYRAELLCYMLTKDAASSLGYDKARIGDLMKFFKISEEAANADKVSKTTLKKVVPEIIARMIGEQYEESVVPADINHLLYGFTKDDNKASLNTKTASTKQTVKLLTDICHRILTDGFYTIDSKQVKVK